VPGIEAKILWIEVKGYEHILDRHSREFIDVGAERLNELVEAATRIGVFDGMQGNNARPRTILGLVFYNTPLAVGPSVATHGYTVGMNRQSLRRFLNITVLTENELAGKASWPLPEQEVTTDHSSCRPDDNAN
jgi:hypothetical protein